MSREPSLEVRNINKQFPGVKALDDVSMCAYANEVTALIGINGAGKSTLMNILAGEIQADSGKFYINKREIQIRSQEDAERNSISLIHQEAVVFPALTVAENVFITQLNRFKKNGIISHKEMRSEAKKYLEMLGCNIDPAEKVSKITVGERQMVEIARALSLGAQIILFDEPTSSLTIKEKTNLFRIINSLKTQGKTIIYITHFINEVIEICESAVIMMDGRVVGQRQTKDMTVQAFISMMIGDNVETVQNGRKFHSDKVLLRVNNLSSLPMVKNASFELMQGEILGIWGLLGSGRTELIRAMLRLNHVDNGFVEVLNEKNGKYEIVKNKSLLREVGYVTENRHQDGLFMKMPIWKNITMPNMKHFSSFLTNEKAELQYSDTLVRELTVKTPDSYVRVDKLSGGNQQKVIMSRWVGKKPRLFILDEPTRGVDVGAKGAIHKLILELAQSGATVLLISSELEEMTALCDRVIVLSEGKIVANVPKAEIAPQHLMSLCVKKESVNDANQ